MLIFALADFPCERLEPTARRNASLMTLFYQLGMLTPPWDPAGPPRFACPEVFDDNTDVSKAYGFKFNGQRALGIDKRIAVFEAGHGGRLARLMKVHSFCVSVIGAIRAMDEFGSYDQALKSYASR